MRGAMVKILIGGCIVLLSASAVLGYIVKSQLEKIAALQQRELIYQKSIANAENTILELKKAKDQSDKLYRVARQAEEDSQKRLSNLSAEIRRLANDDPEIPKWGDTAMPNALYDKLLNATSSADL